MQLDLSRLNSIAKEKIPDNYKTPAQEKQDELKEMYNIYQNNIRASEGLQSKILKGVKAGENIYTLFLQAAKAISLMTSNTVFYNQIESDIIDIYGKGLLEPQPLKVEIQATEERLKRLKEAEAREGESDTQGRIYKAIKAHEARIAELQELIKRGKENLGQNLG